MKNTSTYVAIVWALIAAGAISGTVYFSWIVQGDSAARAAALSSAADKATKQAMRLRSQGLAHDTQQQRDKLTALAKTDLLAAVDVIENAGKSAGVTLEVSDAQPLPVSTDLQALGVRPVGFLVQGSGKFTSIMHAAELLSALPIPSSVIRFDIAQTQSSNSKTAVPWHLSIYLSVLTAADLSS